MFLNIRNNIAISRVKKWLNHFLGLFLVTILFFSNKSYANNAFNLPDLFNPDSKETDVLINNVLVPIFGYNQGVNVENLPFTSFLKIFLTALIIVAAIIIIFTTILGMIDTANTGDILGKRGSLTYTSARIVLGTGFLLPLGASGISAIQYVILWLCANGIYLANTIWESYTDNVYSSNLYFSKNTKVEIYKVAKKAFLYEVCLAEGRKSLPVNALNKPLVWERQFKEIYNTPAFKRNSGGQYSLNNKQDFFVNKGLSYKYVIEGNIRKDSKEDYCGKLTISYPMLRPTILDKDFAELRNVTIGVKQNHIEAMRKMIAQDIPELVNIFFENDENDSKKEAFKNKLEATINGYYDSVKNYVQSERNNLSKNEALGIQEGVKEYKKYGIAGAGSFYYLIAKNLSSINEAVNILPDVSAANENPKFLYLEEKNVKRLKELSPRITTTMEIGGLFFDRVSKEINISLDPNEVTVINVAENKSEEDGIEKINELAEKIDWTPFKSMLGWAQDEGANPLIEIQSMGSTMVSVVLSVLTGAIFASMAFSIFSSTIVSVLLPVIFTIIGAVLIPSLMFAFYVPLMPFIMWLGALFGWFVLLVEAFFGAPMWLVMFMTRSEGSFLGRQEQGVMIIVSLILKPTLMILGIIASFALLHPLFGILNFFYGFVASSIIFSTNPFTGLVLQIMAFIFYFVLVNKLVSQIFGLIHSIPDSLLTWIGGPLTSVIGQSSSKLEGQTGGALNSYTSQLANTATQIASGAHRSLHDTALAKKNKQEGDYGAHLNKWGGGNNNYDRRMGEIEKSRDNDYKNFLGRGGTTPREDYYKDKYTPETEELKDLALAKNYDSLQDALNYMRENKSDVWRDKNSPLQGKSKDDLENEMKAMGQQLQARGFEPMARTNLYDQIKAKKDRGGYDRIAPQYGNDTRAMGGTMNSNSSYSGSHSAEMEGGVTEATGGYNSDDIQSAILGKNNEIPQDRMNKVVDVNSLSSGNSVKNRDPNINSTQDVVEAIKRAKANLNQNENKSA